MFPPPPNKKFLYETLRTLELPLTHRWTVCQLLTGPVSTNLLDTLPENVTRPHLIINSEMLRSTITYNNYRQCRNENAGAYGNLSKLQDPLVLGLQLLQDSLPQVAGMAQGGAEGS